MILLKLDPCDFVWNNLAPSRYDALDIIFYYICRNAFRTFVVILIIFLVVQGTP